MSRDSSTLWEYIHVANELLFEQSLSFSKDNSYTPQPGDLAVCRGSLFKAYTDFLRQQKLPLTAFERKGAGTIENNFQEPFRYCLILQRLPQDQFLVCYFTTYGNARTARDIVDPIQKFFALGVGNTKYPAGVKPLNVAPRWNANRVSFVFAVPVIRKSVESTRTQVRYHVPPAELRRLIGYIKERVREFRVVHHALRKDRKGPNQLFAEHDMDKLDNEQSETPALRNLSGPRSQNLYQQLTKLILPHPHGEFIPKMPLRIITFKELGGNDLRWLSNRFAKDILHSSRYLNSMPRQSAKTFRQLPRPYFSPALRTTAKSIGRIFRI